MYIFLYKIFSFYDITIDFCSTHPEPWNFYVGGYELWIVTGSDKFPSIKSVLILKQGF